MPKIHAMSNQRSKKVPQGAKMTERRNWFYKRHAPALANRGYNIIPIRPGKKSPTDSGWQKQFNKPERVKQLAENGRGNCGIGVICGTALKPGVHVTVLDIDIEDKTVCDAFTEGVMAITGKAPTRVGDAPKRALFYRTDEPLTKQQTEKYQNLSGGESAQVELLGLGQYVVVEGIHPKTGAPYQFEGEPLHERDVAELPKINSEQIDDIFKLFRRVMRDFAWVDTSTGEIAEGEKTQLFFAGAKTRLGLQVSEIREMLNKVAHRADEYNFWLRVGFALHHEGDGAEAYFDLWDEWSRGSVKYAGVNDLVARWSKFHAGPQKGGKIVTLRSLLKAVKDEEQTTQEDKLSELLKTFVLVVEGSQVRDLNDPKTKFSLRDFHNCYEELVWTYEDDKGSKKTMPLTKVWVRSKDKMRVERETFMPGQPPLCRDAAGKLCYNTCQIPPASIDYDPARLRVFNEHMDFLFPVKKEREWFVQWLAFNLQRPALRCKVTPLHISPAHRTGRGWVTDLLGQLLGMEYCKKTSMGELAGDKSIFNGYFFRSLVCCIDEVREQGKNAYLVNDKIRDKLTDNTLDVNIKFGVNSTMQIYTNFFFMSNHWDALIIPPEDKRIIVLTGPDRKQNTEYYTRLYGWLTGPEGVRNVDALRTYLYRSDLSGFKWDTAPFTEGKRQMVEYSMTETEELINALLANPAYPVATFQWVIETLQRMEGADEFSTEINKSQVERILKTKGVKTYPQKIKFKGKTTRVWALAGEIYDNEKTREILEQQERGPLEGC